VWSIDFVHDKLSNGRPYKMLTLLDEYTREALSVKPTTRIGSDEVLEVLYPLLLRRGKPEYICSDHGPKFSSSSFKDWLLRVGITPIQIYPGSPWENGYDERSNGTLRREILNAEWFATTRQAQTAINQKPRPYNHVWPYHALGMRPPIPKPILVNHQITGTDRGG
jgi:transposase InsO family protein